MAKKKDEEKTTEDTEQERNKEALLETLEKLGGQRVSEDSLIFQGTQMILPERMTAIEARDYLTEFINREEENTHFTRTFRYRPWDGAVAVRAVLKRVFGIAGVARPEWTFFGKRPPEMREVETAFGRTEQVPWGELGAPLFNGEMHYDSVNDAEYGQLFRLHVFAAHKYRAHVEGLFDAIEMELKSNSIYKGTAINGQPNPEFIDLSGVDPARVIYSQDVRVQLQANVWSLLEHTQTLRSLGQPLKRAVLLEGDYGTGKTLGAFLTAQKAVENDWTFIYCRPGKDDLATVLATARLYQPCVVFFEDVDLLAAGGSEADPMSRVLDLFDGIQAKGTEILCVLTTNHPKSIHKGMLRPGRLDAVVHFGPLDTVGIAQMIESVVPDSMRESDLDYDAIGEAMGVGEENGFLPAFVREAIDRAVRYSIARNDGQPGTLETQDFVDAAIGLRPQLDLMTGARESVARDPLSSGLTRIVRDAVHGTALIDGEGDPAGAYGGTFLDTTKANGH